MMRNHRDLTSISIARGLAAFSVFVYHYGVGATLAKYSGIAAFHWAGIPGGNYGVTLFFVISGFCIHGSEWRRVQAREPHLFDTRAYAVRRFRRIYPIYFFTLLLSCLIGAATTGLPTVPDFVLHALLLHGFSSKYFNTINVVLWTISIEAFFYLIYPFWLRVRLRLGLASAFIGGIIISVLSYLVTAATCYPYELPSRWFFLNTWGGWLLGALMAETMETHPAFYRSWRWWAPGVALWLFGVWSEATNFCSGRLLLLRFPLRIYMSAWPLSALVLSEDWFGSAQGLVAALPRFFSWIGLASYSLYLLHEPMIEARNLLISSVTKTGVRLSIEVLWFFVILATCWISYRQLELRFMKRTKRVSSPIAPCADPLSRPCG